MRRKESGIMRRPGMRLHPARETGWSTFNQSGVSHSAVAGGAGSIVKFRVEKLGQKSTFTMPKLLCAQNQLSGCSQRNYFWFLIWHLFTSFQTMCITQRQRLGAAVWSNSSSSESPRGIFRLITQFTIGRPRGALRAENREAFSEAPLAT